MAPFAFLFWLAFFSPADERVLAKRPIDGTYSVMVAAAGVFIVSGEANQLRMVLDTANNEAVSATIDHPLSNSVCVHSYSWYGMYQGSVKYFYDLASTRAPVKVPYRKDDIRSSALTDAKLRYTTGNHIITIEPGAEDSALWYSIEDAQPPPYSAPQPTTLRAPHGESVVIANVTPPGQEHRESVIHVGKQAFPVPIPTMAMYRQALPEKQAPGEIQDDIGPFVLRDDRVWFANTFYDGEGVSGIGAIGVFDIYSRKYEMRYLPEIAPWSGSAILSDGEDLWVGLMRRPEGADIGAGLLRYNTSTGVTKRYEVPDVIHTIDHVGSTIYCGTSNGLYTIHNGKVTQLRFEPDGTGKFIMVARQN